jgi:tRNA(Ile)-lysidine synthase
MPTSNEIYNIEKKASDFIISNDLIYENDRVLIGLSGGPDSVFALHILIKLSSVLKYKVFAAHVNHSLRGKESDDDEEFCTKLCERTNIKLHKKSIDIAAVRANSKRSTEELARIERYSFFNDLSDKYSYNKIVTAHNKDDNAETVLLNLIRGTGLSGLSGIPIRRDNIVRPFLHITKEEILEYLAYNNYQFRIDSSNIENEFDRNFVRNQLIPSIKNSLNPKVIESIDKTSSNLKAANETIQKMVNELWDNSIKINGFTFDIHLPLFNEDEIIQGEILKKLFNEEMHIEFNSKLFEDITSLAQNQVGKKISLAAGFKAVRERNSIHIIIPNEQNEISVEFSVGQSVQTSVNQLSTEMISIEDYRSCKVEGCEFISADNLHDIFILRNWKSGDRFIPLGMKGHKKISDYLTDRKIPNTSKKEVCVLTNGEKIIWVEGFAIDERYRITKNTQRVLKLCLKKL